ncbi:metal ABC transporter solute-binding protein, Zn/Mn family [Sinomonas terrae]|uniref:Zinc ABC transporter substrate-binding protein n=1 Tax=Sinomonas terrae TaxID=2908838 RepID=A0ABS9TZ51_9MICC|nr:zinc ABC transporter substrate-binding protein [Sinomonas terrae]MCH6469717.1 zinc ABC transporter substrate-binding protein [Sinomonas terrae]
MRLSFRRVAQRPPSPTVAARRVLTASLAVAGTLALAACSSQAGSGSGSSQSGTGQINVVASTNVYGDIAKSIGGDKVNVTSIISKASQDPHSYEATTQDRLAVSKAKLAIVNGGGYDDFMTRLTGDAKLTGDSVLNAVDASGLRTGADASAGAEFNEHIWYSQDAMQKVAQAIADRLGKLDPADAPTFTQRAAQWDSKLGGITSKLAAIKAAHSGEGVAVTEPVPLYMLEAAGLENKTPESFSSAVEAGNDVPPAALKEMQDLLSSHGVALLAFNPQTESPQTEALKKFSQDAKVPVADFLETMPEGSDYITWMAQNADEIATALGAARS